MIRLSDFCGGTPGASGLNAGNTQIAIDGNGNALVVWAQSDGVNESIWYNRSLWQQMFH